MKMTWKELLGWVKSGKRKKTELEKACRRLGLSDKGTVAELRQRLQEEIAKHPEDKVASWSPGQKEVARNWVRRAIAGVVALALGVVIGVTIRPIHRIGIAIGRGAEWVTAAKPTEVALAATKPTPVPTPDLQKVIGTAVAQTGVELQSTLNQVEKRLGELATSKEVAAIKAEIMAQVKAAENRITALETNKAEAQQGVAQETRIAKLESLVNQLLATTPGKEKPTIDHPRMKAYQETLAYTVSPGMAVPNNLLKGFSPVPSLVMTNTVYPNGYRVKLPAIPTDLKPYKFFPQEDPKNPKPVWKVPIASYRDGDNWFCDDVTGWCADAVDAFNWIVWTGETVCHPAVGCVTDPNGGAVMVMIINLHDSDEAWDVRNGSGVYVTAGFAGFGRMFDLSGKSYDVGEGIGAIRNHYLYNLGSEPEYTGQCGSSGLCGTVTYVVVARVWDRPEIGIGYSHYELLDYGQWVRK